MNILKITSFLMILFFFISSNSFANEEIKNAIVKIYTQSIKPYYSDPWTMNSPDSKSGSGCIIEGNRIITNAHVVSDHTLILVRKYGEAKRYKADLQYISHDVDLAILTVDDPDFYRGIKPLKIDDLPNTQEEVLVFGYPKGGDTLSITKGVISRIEHERYAQSSLSFLASQIDAPINPGNSGGPAIIDGKVVGIIMQTLRSSENIGYMVPTPVIKHFLKDIEDGIYDGFPGLGVITQKMENEDHKAKYGMQEDDTGVLVLKVVPGSAADTIIKEKDILLSINGNKISENGTVEFRPKHRTHFAYFVQLAQLGEKINIEILREGIIKNVTVNLNMPIQYSQLVNIHYDKLPSYYIYGGLVFSPLSLNYLKEWGGKWYTRVHQEN
ncbi:MAG: trypsin-like serine protease [Candidatus Dadabacteria bacterium]|nr:trypsin-like serine protease [Candidatus Dadabacteria bacterium]NIQ13199.1 trypsin-like serine protease [Candidatus Dadabacteria bacterium]